MQPAQVGARQPVLGQAPSRKCKCYFSSVNGSKAAPEQIGKRPNVVLVRVRQHDPFELETILLQVCEVRQQQPNPEFALLGEHHAGVDDDGALVALHHHQVEPDFTEPAQRNDLYWSGFRNCHLTFPIPLTTAQTPQKYIKWTSYAKARREYRGSCPQPALPDVYNRV